MTLGPKYVTDVIDAFSGFLSGIRKLQPGLGSQPIEGSIADTERRGFPQPELLIDAYGIAGLMIESSADHIDTFVRTITGPIASFPGCTCVRSMLEPCALAAWLTEPDIGAGERASRVFATRYDAIVEQSKWASAAYPGKSFRADTDARIETIEREAARLGYGPVRDQNGNRIGIGCRKPNATTLIADMLGEAAAYRLLSAVAHGQHWALSQIGFEQEDPTGSTRPAETVPVRTLRKTARPEVIAFLGVCALRSFARPVTSMLKYGGHDTGPFDRLIETTYDLLRVPKAQRLSPSKL